MGNTQKNIIYNVSYQILTLLLPLITSSYLARVVGARGVGEYSYTYSIALFFSYFTILGLNNYGNRVIAANQQDIRKRSIAFWEIYFMQAICFGICLLPYIGYSLWLSRYPSLMMIQLVFVLSSLFDINWFFFGMEMFDKTVIRNTVVKIMTTVAIVTLVKSPNDVNKYSLIMALGYLFSQFALWPFLKRYLIWPGVKNLNIRQHIRPNLLMFIPVIAVSVYQIADKVMLGYLSTQSMVGYFESAQKIINVPIAFITAVGTVMLPHVSALVSKKMDSHVARYRDFGVVVVTAFCVGAMFGIFSVSELLTQIIFGTAFMNSASIMSILAITIVFLGVGNVIRTQFLIPYKFDRIYVKSAIYGALCNVAVNFVLIPKFSANGAAFGTVVAEIVVCFYQIYKVKSSLPVRAYIRSTIHFVLCGLVMYLGLNLVNLNTSPALIVLIKLILGFGIYGLLCCPLLVFHYRKFCIEGKAKS